MPARQKVLMASDSREQSHDIWMNRYESRTPSTVDFIQELGAWDGAVTTKSVRHDPRIRGYSLTEKVPPSVQWQRSNVKINRQEGDGPILTYKKHRPDNDYLPQPIVSIYHHQNNFALLPDRVHEASLADLSAMQPSSRNLESRASSR